MESVADEVLRLRFTGRNVESMYRNDDRIRELFIGRIGSIAGFSRSATKDVNGSVGFKGIAELAGARGGEQASNTTWRTRPHKHSCCGKPLR